MKLNALIVDDEHSGRTALKILLNKDFYHLFEKVVTASSLAEAIKVVSEESFNIDICFLDIELNSQSGFELLPYLPFETKVVFVTAYSQYAIKAIKERVFDYLLKPLNPIELKTCINQYEKEFFGNGKLKRHLLIKEQVGTIPVRFENIEYLKAYGPYSKIYSIDNTVYTTSKTLKTLIDILGQDFIRIHRSYLVNKMMIRSFKKDSLTTIQNTCLPVSRTHAKELSLHF